MIDYIGKGATYSIGLTLFGTLLLYAAIKIRKHWRIGLGMVWLVFGFING